ncbi:hypothetical protein [Trichocoleus sp. FACHB-262]|uniref:hypothetical protein n=1 Tax=Trichocoleus sp. FACHB-262 TaxID=2692869 RepID=UPI00168491A0|nr:hypothetical protein [Trichocoleus sp. FACHB-262]MBD2120555.1 hypothetical protein [Trichocoleus sp. FACHB-262]
MIRAILALVLVGLLTACGNGIPGLSDRVVQQAIALQVSQTQQTLAQQLRLKKPPKVEVKQVAIDQQDSLKIQGLPAYHLQGTYDLTLKFPSRQVTQEKNPFEVYLQQQPDQKNWKLAQLSKSDTEAESTWVTEPLQ